jgi:hypothetical protein
VILTNSPVVGVAMSSHIDRRQNKGVVKYVLVNFTIFVGEKIMVIKSGKEATSK